MFPNGMSMTIASNGWTTTSQNQIHNENSLYGQVSAKPNSEAGQCRMGNGKTTRTFDLKNLGRAAPRPQKPARPTPIRAPVTISVTQLTRIEV